jgi:hypothetical protein
MPKPYSPVIATKILFCRNAFEMRREDISGKCMVALVASTKALYYWHPGNMDADNGTGTIANPTRSKRCGEGRWKAFLWEDQ